MPGDRTDLRWDRARHARWPETFDRGHLATPKSQSETCDRTTICQRSPPHSALRLVIRFAAGAPDATDLSPGPCTRAAHIAFVISCGDKELSSDDRLLARTLMPTANTRPGVSRTDVPRPSRIAGWLSRVIILGEFITLVAFAARRSGSPWISHTGRTNGCCDEDSSSVTDARKRCSPIAQLSALFS